MIIINVALWAFFLTLGGFATFYVLSWAWDGDSIFQQWEKPPVPLAVFVTALAITLWVVALGMGLIVINHAENRDNCRKGVTYDCPQPPTTKAPR